MLEYLGLTVSLGTKSWRKKRRAFFNAYTRLHNRIQLFVSLPFAKLDRLSLSTRVNEIGKS